MQKKPSSSSSCKHCSRVACVSYEGAPFCLLHYHAFSTHGKDESIKAIVTNEKELSRQAPQAKKLLREAMADVLVRMHDFQRREQASLHADPLSILSLHAPSVVSNASAIDTTAHDHAIIHSNKRPAKEAASTLESKKHKKPDLWNTSKAEEAGNNDPEKEISVDELSQRLIDGGGDEDDYLYSTGPPCTNCLSTNTLRKFESTNSGMTGTRSEVWGNKDNEGGHSKSVIVCKSCGYEKNQFD